MLNPNRCNSPLLFVVEVSIGNLLNESDTMSQVNLVLEDIVGDTFTVRENDGSILTIDVKDIGLGENQGKAQPERFKYIFMCYPPHPVFGLNWETYTLGYIDLYMCTIVCII